MAELLKDTDLGLEGAPGELKRGSRLGRYELLLPIAKGGMARVWAARLQGQRGFSKTVAIKTILPHLAQEAEFEKMFLDEARIAAGVHHPNVCEIYELGEEGKILYMAMEWVSGESLVHILRSDPNAPPSLAPPTGTKVTPLHPHLAARIVADAAAGLHAAHNLKDDDGQPLNVVHRDVSPHNILLSDGGNVKVADFGVAKALGQMSGTQAGQVKGKMAYMSPEQIMGSGVDRRSDVFALGVVLYEATTGRKPFVGDNDAMVMHSILQGTYVAPTKLVRGYPRELEEVVARALNPQPAGRFATAERMHLALEELIARSGSVVTPSHVASLVSQRVGPMLERRREKIRAAATAAEDISASGAGVPLPGATPSARSAPSASGVKPQGYATPSPAAVVPSASTPAPSFAAAPPAPVAMAPARAQPAPMPNGSMRYVVAASIGIVIACGVALAGVLALRKMDAQPEAPAQTTTPRASGGAAPSAKPAIAAASATSPPTLGPVSFKITPPEAVLMVDGKTLGADVRTLERPKEGAALEVTVQAAGYVDEMVTIDDHTPASVDVALVANAAAAPSTSATSHAARPPSLPANPYGP